MGTTKTKSKRKKRRLDSSDRINEVDGWVPTDVQYPEGAKLFDLDNGKTRRICIIGYEAGKGNPSVDEGELIETRRFFIHNGLGESGKARYTCLRHTFHKKCPVCEHRDMLNKQGADWITEIKQFAEQKRNLYNILDMDDQESGIQIWNVSDYLFNQKLVDAVKARDEDEPWHMYADEEEGSILKLGVSLKTWAGKETGRVSTINFKPRPEFDDDLYDSCFNLDEIPMEVSYDVLKKALEASLVGPTDDEGANEPAESDDRETPEDDEPLDTPESDDDDDWDTD